MNFLYQIVTSNYVYTLYEEDEYPLLHVKDLHTNRTRDITNKERILDILFFDSEVSTSDYEDCEGLVSVCRHS